MKKSFALLALALVAFSRSSVTWAQSKEAGFRVVIAGLTHGHVAGFHSSAAKRTDVQIVGIAEPDQRLARRYADQFKLDSHLFYTDLDQLLANVKPQAILAYTNTHEHRRVVEIAARHHIPVMMEKPLAVSIDDALAIERAALATAARGIPPALADIRKVVIHDGHNGPKEIGVPPEFLDWLADPARNGGGALFDFGCYGADLMTWLMQGEVPKTVTAVLQTMKPQIYPRVDDEATVILTYPKAQAILQASWNWPFGRKDMEVYGETGQAITVGRDTVRVRRKNQTEEQVETSPSLPAPYDDSISYLMAVVSGKIQPSGPSALDTNIAVVRILDAARESARTGKTQILH